MKMTVKYVRGGKVVSMDKRYADILIKAKRVVAVPDETLPAFSGRFKSAITTKPLTEKETVTKKANAPAKFASKKADAQTKIKAEIEAEIEEPVALVKLVMPVKENEAISDDD